MSSLAVQQSPNHRWFTNSPYHNEPSRLYGSAGTQQDLDDGSGLTVVLGVQLPPLFFSAARSDEGGATRYAAIGEETTSVVRMQVDFDSVVDVWQQIWDNDDVDAGRCLVLLVICTAHVDSQRLRSCLPLPLPCGARLVLRSATLRRQLLTHCRLPPAVMRLDLTAPSSIKQVRYVSRKVDDIVCFKQWEPLPFNCRLSEHGVRCLISAICRRWGVTFSSVQMDSDDYVGKTKTFAFRVEVTNCEAFFERMGSRSRFEIAVEAEPEALIFGGSEACGDGSAGDGAPVPSSVELHFLVSAHTQQTLSTA